MILFKKSTEMWITRMNTDDIIKERRRIEREERLKKYNKIRALYRAGLSMDAICRVTNSSKTTVFFAIKGRSNKAVENRKALTKK